MWSGVHSTPSITMSMSPGPPQPVNLDCSNSASELSAAMGTEAVDLYATKIRVVFLFSDLNLASHASLFLEEVNLECQIII